MIVQKGNRQLKISEEKLDEFLQMGYSRVDEKTGEVVQAGKAITYEDIKAENDTLKAKLAEYKEQDVINEELESLKTENEKLKAENDKLKKENAKLKKEPATE